MKSEQHNNTKLVQRETQQPKLEIKTKSVDLIPCGCGKCGIMIPAVNKQGRPVRYLCGHGPKSYGEKNSSWKGENVGYEGLHRWVRPRLPEPPDGSCQICHRTDKKLELACIGEYNRLDKLESNWKWACHACNIADPRREKKWRETMLKRYTRLEINAKIDKAMIGKNSGKRVVHTPETRAKISQARMGPKNPMFGRHGPKHPNFGKPLSDDIKQKIRMLSKRCRRCKSP